MLDCSARTRGRSAERWSWLGSTPQGPRTKTDWLLVKGTSDWGRDKTSGPQASAARNAADFVVRLLRLGNAQSDQHEGS